MAKMINNIYRQTTPEERWQLVYTALIRTLGTFTIAGNSLFDTITMLSKDKAFKDGVKYNANKAMESYYATEQLGKDFFEDQQDLFMTMLQYMDEDSQSYVDGIRNEVKRELLRCNVGEYNAELFSRIQTTKWLIDSTWCLYDKMNKKMRGVYGINIKKTLRLQPIRQAMVCWGKVAKAICVSEKSIDLDNKKINEKIDEFVKYVASDEFINRNTFYAIRELPKYNFYYKEGEYEQLCEKYLGKNLHI